MVSPLVIALAAILAVIVIGETVLLLIGNRRQRRIAQQVIREWEAEIVRQLEAGDTSAH